MAKWYEAANEASFKATADGYIFQSPNPWMFARPRYYLVQEAQKKLISEHMGRWRVLLLLLSVLGVSLLVGSFVAFVTLWPSTFLRLVAPALHSGAGAFTALLFVVLMILIAPLIAIPQIYLARGLRRLLADAPRTNERITMHEQMATMATSVSGKLLLIGLAGGLCLIAAAAINMIDAYADAHFYRSLFLSVLPPFVGGVALTSYVAYMTRLRVKLKPDATAKIEVN